MTQYTYEWWWILQTSQKLSHEDFDKIKLKISNCEYFMKNFGADINLPTVISLIFLMGMGTRLLQHYLQIFYVVLLYTRLVIHPKVVIL